MRNWKPALAAAAALTISACNELEGEPTTAPTTVETDTSEPDTSEPDTITPSPIQVTGFNAIAVDDGGETAPLTLGGVPPFSMGSTDLTFINQSEQPVTLEAVTLEVLAPAEAIEFALTQPGRTERLPVETTNITVEPGHAVSFGIHFVPLASGARDVRVRFDHTAGDDYVVTVRARGRDNATFSPVVTTDLERILGRSNVEHANGLELGGFDADPQGNLYFSGNVTEWSDLYGANMVFGKVAPDGSLAWLYEWDEAFPQQTAPVGNNGDTGGPADSLDVDANGDVYVTGYRVACDKAGGFPENAFVVSLGSQGSLRWARSLNNDGPSDVATLVKQYLRGYAIDASLPDRVLVAGRVSDTGGFLLTALSKADGSTLWAHDITMFTAGESRVGALAVDPATGAAYVGGILGALPFMARVDGVDGAAPALNWAQSYGYGATSIHGATLDGNGLLVVFENRGLQTMYLSARVKADDGAVVWSKVFDPNNAGDTNASLTVVKHNGTAIFGGRIAINPFDTQGGDGFLLGLDPATGSYKWSAFHYGGKGAEEMAHDYIMGLVSTPSGLWALHQQTPGTNNHHHFWGRWYESPNYTLDFPGGDGGERLVDGELPNEDLTSETELVPLTDLVKNWDTLASECGAGAWVDWTDRFDVLEPVQAERDRYQTGTHGLIQKLDVAD